MTASFKIPVVKIRKGGAKNAKTVKEMETALRYGDFVTVVGDTTTVDCMHAAYDPALQLFAHGEHVLRRYEHPDVFHNRGYSPPGGEDTGDGPDIHRQFWMSGCSWEHGPDADPEDCQFDKYDAPPVGLSPHFGTANERLMRSGLRDGRILLGCIEAIAGFEPGRLVSMTMGADSVLRTIYYDSAQIEGTVLAGKHTDINLLTGLVTKNMKGLRLYIDGEPIVPDIPFGSAIFNSGEMLEQIPGLSGIVTMVRHDVVVVPGIAVPRVQQAIFIHAKRATVLRHAEGDKPAIVCGPWFRERIAAISVKK